MRELANQLTLAPELLLLAMPDGTCLLQLARPLCAQCLMILCVQVADIQAAVQFMRSRGKNVTCVLGHSKGGINILLYGSRHAGDVPRLVNLSGRFCVRDGVLQRVGEQGNAC